MKSKENGLPGSGGEAPVLGEAGGATAKSPRLKDIIKRREDGSYAFDVNKCIELLKQFNVEIEIDEKKLKIYDGGESLNIILIDDYVAVAYNINDYGETPPPVCDWIPRFVKRYADKELLIVTDEGIMVADFR